MVTERMIGVEQARPQLGQLLEEVARGGEPVMLTKRGQALAVLVTREEYVRLKEAATRFARAELQDRLAEIRRRVQSAGVEPDMVDEALRAARGIE